MIYRGHLLLMIVETIRFLPYLICFFIVDFAYSSVPSIHSAPLGEARQKKMRRRRSKSPGNSKRPPEELRQHIEFDLLEPTDDMTEEQLREIPYVNVE